MPIEHAFNFILEFIWFTFLFIALSSNLSANINNNSAYPLSVVPNNDDDYLMVQWMKCKQVTAPNVFLKLFNHW